MRSYKALAAVVLALVLLAPLLGAAAAKAYSLQPGTGKVFTKEVSVNGMVEFAFNLSPAYEGAEAHIYLSANGLPNVYYGDVAITPAFSTSNVTAVIGNITISAGDVYNFLWSLSTNGSSEDALSAGATKETTVLKDLITQGWALVYLKYSTAAPVQYGGSAPAIAAGPFNLTIKPMIKVTIKPMNNLSYVPIAQVTTANKAFLNVTGANQFASGIISDVVSNKMDYDLYGSFSNFSVTTGSLLIGGNYPTTSSDVFSSVSLNSSATPPSLGISGTLLSGSIILPALTNAVHLKSGAMTSYFNMSAFQLNVISSATSITIGTSSTAYVKLEPSGTYTYGTGSVTFSPVNYSLTNYGVSPSTFRPYGLFTPNTTYGTLNIFPSFEVVSESPGVAGPTGQLNPGDMLTFEIYDVPEDTTFAAVAAIGNDTLLPTSPYLYPAEENSESFYTSSGYFVESLGLTFANYSFTYIVSPLSGSGSFYGLIPNAPYYPLSYLGLEYELHYSPIVVSGTISPYNFIANDTLWYNKAGVPVYPFYQVFTSNRYGMFYFNTTATGNYLLLGNYLLVRGFGFTTSLAPAEYPVMTYSTYSSTLAPLSSSLVAADTYGDFAYISQVPVSGSLYLNVFSKAPGTYPVTVANPTYTSLTTNASGFTVPISEHSGNAIVYVNPTPEVFGPTPIVTGLLGQVMLPSFLLKYPYEATQYITNMTAPLIPASEGEISTVVVAGAGFTANVSTGKYGTVVLQFNMSSPSLSEYYFAGVNISQVTPFDDKAFSGTWYAGGYGVFYNVPVPNLPGTAAYIPNAYDYAYNISIYNASVQAGSTPSYTGVFVARAADILVGQYSIGYLLTNFTHYNGSVIVKLSPLLTSPGYLLTLVGTPFTEYIFGSPISYNTTQTLKNPYSLPVYINVTTLCGLALVQVPIGYIINGTLFNLQLTGVGSTLQAGVTLQLCPGYNTISESITGPYVPQTAIPPVTVTRTIAPGEVTLYFVQTLPAYPVQVQVVAPASASGSPVEVLVPTEVPVLGLPVTYTSDFFVLSKPVIAAYISTPTGVEQLPSSDIMYVTTIPGYYVYFIVLPSNVTGGTLAVTVTQTATYIFTGEQFTGEAAAATGVVQVNTTAIQAALNKFESQIGSLLQGLNSTVRSEYAGLSSQLSGLSTQVSGLNATIAKDYASMASMLSGLSTKVSSLNSTIASEASMLSSEIGTAESTLSGYIAGNFSAVNASLNTLETDITNLGGQLGAIASNVESIKGTVNTVASDLSGIYSSLQSVNSTVSSAASTISSVASSLSSLSSTVSSMSSTVSSISSTVTSMSSTLNSVSSTVSSISSTVTSMSSTLSSLSSTASGAESEAHSAASTAASAATYSLGALIVAIIALALIAYVAFAKF
ncbi:hypothetical protein [Acidilobus saccharovorans]|uniref:hypothetical protein n=1 Tax=Acidilobus saccharovorans TaxID=242703 RepID=UPI0006626827|nr:hypothetical protein [Acidilobus saccharovorans]